MAAHTPQHRWATQAACRHLQPEQLNTDNPEPELQQMCAECPVLRECAIYAYTTHLSGFAAGLTSTQRTTQPLAETLQAN